MKEQDHLEMLRYAAEIAAFSNCSKMNFGCVIVDPEGNIHARGYNESLRPGCCLRGGIKSGTQAEKCNAIHAEQMAALQLDADEGKLHVLTLYLAGKNVVTGEPWENGLFYCSVCARLLKAAGIKSLVLPTTDGYRRITIDEAMEEAYGVAVE